ncbi:TPA: hypothetical protein IHM15_004606 [Escherichia coli]|nr:hypothetical protein [Escherichia coli]
MHTVPLRPDETVAIPSAIVTPVTRPVIDVLDNAARRAGRAGGLDQRYGERGRFGRRVERHQGCNGNRGGKYQAFHVEPLSC